VIRAVVQSVRLGGQNAVDGGQEAFHTGAGPLSVHAEASGLGEAVVSLGWSSHACAGVALVGQHNTGDRVDGGLR
jgi:hypothetical protein